MALHVSFVDPSTNRTHYLNIDVTSHGSVRVAFYGAFGVELPPDIAARVGAAINTSAVEALRAPSPVKLDTTDYERARSRTPAGRRAWYFHMLDHRGELIEGWSIGRMTWTDARRVALDRAVTINARTVRLVP